MLLLGLKKVFMFPLCPFDPELLASCCVDFSLQSIHFNHNAQQPGGGGGEGSRTLIDWQVFAYTVWDKMSAGVSVLTCKGLLAKQTDEGNLSCGGVCGAASLVLLLVSSVTCHGARAGLRLAERKGSGRLATNKRALRKMSTYPRAIAVRINGLINGRLALRVQQIKKSNRRMAAGFADMGNGVWTPQWTVKCLKTGAKSWSSLKPSSSIGLVASTN